MADENACELPNAIKDECVIAGYRVGPPKPAEPEWIRSGSGGSATFDLESMLTDMDCKLERIVQQMDRAQGLLTRSSIDRSRLSPGVNSAAPTPSLSGGESLTSAAESVVKDMVKRGSISQHQGELSFKSIAPQLPDVTEKVSAAIPALLERSEGTDSEVSEELELQKSEQPSEEKQHRSQFLGTAIRANKYGCTDLWEFLEDPESGKHARRFNEVSKVIIVVSVCVSLLQHIEGFRKETAARRVTAIMELMFDTLFAAEFAFRVSSCPSWSAFFFRLTSWIDMLSSVSLILRTVSIADEQDDGSSIGLILLCVIPVVRLAKLARHFEVLYLLSDAFVSVLTALPVLFYVLTMITMVFSAILYIIEPRDNLSSLPHAVWMTIVTISTVGYGDVTPTSTGGYVTVAVLVSTSALFVAIPVGIIGNAFWASWQSRDRVLLVSRTRVALRKWGYTAEDVKVLFIMVDSDGNGSLDMSEFSELIGQMKLGLSPTRIVKLFSMFDKDNSGSVSHQEFIREMYPTFYLEVCKPPLKRSQTSRQEILTRAASAVSAWSQKT